MSGQFHDYKESPLIGQYAEYKSVYGGKWSGTVTRVFTDYHGQNWITINHNQCDVKREDVIKYHDFRSEEAKRLRPNTDTAGT